MKSAYVESVGKRGASLFLWATVVVILLCSFFNVFPTEKLPFPCDREKAISRPFHRDTIPVAALFAITLLTPPLVFAVVEASISVQRSWWRRCCLVASDYYAGFVYASTIIEILKVLIKEHRPHFFYSCQPDWNTLRCVDGLAVEYNCTREEHVKSKMRMDIYKSFPSGHAALSLYSFLFVSVYVHYRIRSGNMITFFRPWIQLLYMIWALSCSITRVTDNRHYWWDVLSGVLVGLLVSVYMASYCVSTGKFCSPWRSKQQKEAAISETKSLFQFMDYPQATEDQEFKKLKSETKDLR